MTGLNRRQFNHFLAGTGVAALAGTSSLAQAAPGDSTGTMRLVVPFAPGGGGDVLGRLFADKMAVEMGRTIIVENKPGASTTIGTAPPSATRSAASSAALSTAIAAEPASAVPAHATASISGDRRSPK